MSYTPFEIDDLLNSITILVDTREHPGKLFDKRVASFGVPWERHKLDQGDYSYKYIDLDGKEVFMDDSIIIERKMSLNELANNFGKERARFIREFERAKASGTQVHLLVEGDTWEDAYKGTYGNDTRHRSRFHHAAMTASLHAWEQRYGLRVKFCNKERTGEMIRDICRYHLKEKLQNE